ncbi:MAG: DUF1570 domain-containing protein [Planctomycetota bacterium]
MSDRRPRQPMALLASLAFALLFVLSPLSAQGRTRFEDPSEGYRLYVSKAIKPVPTEPNERQVLAKWGGKLEFKEKEWRGEADCTVMLVRIRKSKGPATGADADDDDDEEGGEGEDGDKAKEPQSIRSQSIEKLNSGTTPAQFLKRRGFKHDLGPVEDEREVESKDDVRYVVQQIKGTAFDDRVYQYKEVPIIRTYLMEDDQEYFGLVTTGPFLDPFREIVLDMARSLERIQLGAVDATESDASLGNLGFREQVRRKLVDGWEAFDTDHYIFVTNTRNKKLIDDILVDLELMRTEYIKRFPPVEGVDLEQVISAVRFCETYEDYQAYGGPPGTGGYWNFVDEELVLVDVLTLDKKILKENPNLKNIKVLDVLYHEAMHQYFYYANGNLAPASWFNEGFGEVFAGSVPDRRKSEIKRVERNRFRMAWIKQCQKKDAWPDLRAFLKMTQSEFYGSSILQNYAFGWAFCYFLEEQRQDPKGNPAWGAIPDNYLRNLREATVQKRKELNIDEKDKEWLVPWTNELQEVAFHKTFDDVDLIELEKAWIAAMKSWKR